MLPRSIQLCMQRSLHGAPWNSQMETCLIVQKSSVACLLKSPRVTLKHAVRERWNREEDFCENPRSSPLLLDGDLFPGGMEPCIYIFGFVPWSLLPLEEWLRVVREKWPAGLHKGCPHRLSSPGDTWKLRILPLTLGREAFKASAPKAEVQLLQHVLQ